MLGIADRIRPAAADAVARITAVTGAAPVLLTGDNHAPPTGSPTQAGITDVRAGLLPEDKVDAVRELEAGRASGCCWSATASTTRPRWPPRTPASRWAGPDPTSRWTPPTRSIMRDDLATIPAVIALSRRRARRVVTANLVIAAVIITGLVVWDLAGHLPLPLGVLGHEGSTVIVGLNGLRLLRTSAWAKAMR